MIDEGIKHAPDLYKYGISKIRNNIVQMALNSNIATYIVTEAQGKTNDKLKNEQRNQ